jgi:hypothetical protein
MASKNRQRNPTSVFTPQRRMSRNQTLPAIPRRIQKHRRNMDLLPSLHLKLWMFPHCFKSNIEQTHLILTSLVLLRTRGITDIRG